MYATIKLQSKFRASQARKELVNMKAHRDNSWYEAMDERYQTDPETGEVVFVRTPYYYNTVSGECTYDKPKEVQSLAEGSDGPCSGQAIFEKMKQAFEGKLRLVDKEHHRRVKQARAEMDSAGHSFGVEVDDDFLSAVISVQTQFRKKMAQLGSASRLVNQKAAMKRAQIEGSTRFGGLMLNKKRKRKLQFGEANLGAKVSPSLRISALSTSM